MPHPRTIGVGVIGLGVMGQTHIRAYSAAIDSGIPARLVAVCDPDEARRRGEGGEAGNLGTGGANLFDPAKVHGYADAAHLLADPKVELVSICTPTDTHVDLAIAALRAGKHVLLEKPVAIEPEEVRRLAEFAAGIGLLCMPAMCIRFWPGWDWLHERIKERTYGELRSLVLQRLGTGPGWNSAFYKDVARSGGAIIDLHIHDADFMFWCFGKPVSVRSQGSDQHVTTLYEYAKGPRHTTAEGAWTMHPSAPYFMRYRAAFEKATVEWDLNRSPQLLVYDDAGVSPIELPPGTGYDGEIRHILRAIHAGSTKVDATLDDAVAVAEILAAERRSVEFGGEVRLA
ncbi:MAG: Gfo/Idh/MocA family protein [Phycisphaerales bacterium]